MEILAVKYSLNIDENIGILLNSFPQFNGSIKRYHEKLVNTANLTILNELNPRFSLAVTMSEADGVYVDFGGASIIEQEKSVNETVLGAISDVLNDKCIVILGYRNLYAYEQRIQYFDASFCSSDIEEFDTMNEYNSFIDKLTLPVMGIKRWIRFYKGIFEVSNWSGSEYMKIIR